MINAIGKKNIQTLVSDAEREILILGSMDTAGNSVNLVTGIIRVGISLSASDSIYLEMCSPLLGEFMLLLILFSGIFSKLKVYCSWGHLKISYKNMFLSP